MNSDALRALAWETPRQLAVGDASSTRTVYAIVLALAVLGVALIALAVWLIRQTRPDLGLLAPLERMADRSWRKQDPAQKRRSLDEARPPGAKPLRREQKVPKIDEEFEQSKPAVASFDDLRAQQDAERRRASASDPLLPVAGAADVEDPAEVAEEADVGENPEVDDDVVSEDADDARLDDEHAAVRDRGPTPQNAEVDAPDTHAPDTDEPGSGADDTGELDADDDDLTLFGDD